MRVYVAGPYSQGDVAINVRNALDAAERLIAAGHLPYVPHLSHFWHVIHPHEKDYWLRIDDAWLACCDAIIRLPGPSEGADDEMALAERLGLRLLDHATLKTTHYTA